MSWDKLVSIFKQIISSFLGIFGGKGAEQNSGRDSNISSFNTNIYNLGGSVPTDPISSNSKQLVEVSVVHKLDWVVPNVNIAGHRFHLDFTVINNGLAPLAVNDAWLSINKTRFAFKKFYKYAKSEIKDEDGTKNFPIPVNGNGGLDVFRIEFENNDEDPLRLGDNDLSLFIDLGIGGEIEKVFSFTISQGKKDEFKNIKSRLDPFTYSSIIKVDLVPR